MAPVNILNEIVWIHLMNYKKSETIIGKMKLVTAPEIDLEESIFME